jgi:hypothetical protein
VRSTAGRRSPRTGDLGTLMGKSTAKKAKYAPRKHYELEGGETDDKTGRNVAALVTGSETAACRVITGAEQKSGLGEKLDIPGLIAVLRDQANAVNHGDLAQTEAMLINQATALQSLFARLAERGMGCDTVAGFEVNMRMALRAQSQCRATLETLAAIKNPSSIAFVRQANIAHGPQQVNNGALSEASRAREDETERNKQSGNSDELLPDAGTSATAGEIDPQVETLGKIDGAEVVRG